MRQVARMMMLSLVQPAAFLFTMEGRAVHDDQVPLIDCPYDASSTEFRFWRVGWLEGQIAAISAGGLGTAEQSRMG